MNKIVIIGAGNVGITLLYTLLLTIKEDTNFILIDNDIKKCEGNIEDLRHTLSLNSKNLLIGDYSDIENADLIIIAAGIPYNDNRKVFLKNSFKMINNIMNNINKTNFKGNILVLSNPNDVLTTFVAKNYKYPNKVLGSGTMLDNYRMKYYLSNTLNLPIEDISTMIIGEHGTSQVVDWQNVKYQDKLLINLYDKKLLNSISDKTCNVAYEIVKNKGYTNFGIGKVASDLVKALLSKESSTMIISSYDENKGIAYSTLSLIENGNIKKIDNINLKDNAKLDESIQKISNEYQIFNNKKIIGFDLDDTITDIRSDMMEEAKIFDLSINGNGIIDNDKYLLGEKYKWSKENRDTFFLKHRSKVVNRAKLRDNALLVMNKLKEDGYKIIIITARKRPYYTDPYQETMDYLQKNKVPFDKLIVNATSKSQVCLLENIDIFVDDMPTNCEEVANIKKVKVFMMDNVDNFTNDNCVKKVKDFLELYEVINNE